MVVYFYVTKCAFWWVSWCLWLVNTLCINLLYVVPCSRIPDSVGKDIEKACQSIYPLHDVYVRKVKMLKKPKFECKWRTAVTRARACGFLFSTPCGNAWWQTVSVPDDRLITTHWDHLTFPYKKTIPFSLIVWKDEAGFQLCKILNGFEAWWMKHYSIIAVFTLNI